MVHPQWFFKPWNTLSKNFFFLITIIIIFFSSDESQEKEEVGEQNYMQLQKLKGVQREEYLKVSHFEKSYLVFFWAIRLIPIPIK